MNPYLRNIMQELQANGMSAQDVINMIKTGNVNPQTMLGQMIQKNPKVRNALMLVEGKNPNQLMQTFFNMCNEQRISPLLFARAGGLNLPK